MNKIITLAGYWNTLQNRTKVYWRKTASQYNQIFICTSRPNARRYKGSTKVRRASTRGKWGKSADFKALNVEKMLQEGYILVD